MQTTILNTCSINASIFTDEEINVPVTINYDFYQVNDTLGAFGIVVTDIDYKLDGKTSTPKYIIDEQVEHHIKSNHCLSIDFEL
jgi:hypothetical protein